MSDESSKPKILVVDNSKTTRLTMCRILEQQGYRTVAAASGAEAIEMVQADDFNLLVMDLYMPLMNGYEACKVIRQLQLPVKDIPIIALTSSSDDKDVAISEEAGMNEYVVKSTDYSVLFQTIDKYTGLD